MNDQISEDDTYKELYIELKSICLRIYYARISGDFDSFKGSLVALDNYFREPNMN